MPRSRFWRVRTASIVVAVVMVGAACSSSAQSAKSATRSAPVEQLMTQTAGGGSWRTVGGVHVLTLTQVSPVTVVFGDRPERRATTMRTQALVSGWHDAFGSDAPNAAVQLTGGNQDQDTTIVTLSAPHYDAATATLSYDAKALGSDAGGSLSSFRASDKELPASFSAVTVFIDGTSATLPTRASTASKVKPCTTPGAPAGKPLKMSIVNTSSYSDDDVYVALTGVPLTPTYTSWDASPRDLINTSVPLSCLPKDPTVAGGHAYSFELGEGIGSGLLWISLGSPITSGLPTVQPSFDTSLYRFANVEFAYPGQGDMTNVDQFSFPVNLATYAAGSQTVAEASSYTGTTCGIVNALKSAVVAYAGQGADWNQTVVRDTSGGFVRVVSPKQRARQLSDNGTNPYRQGWPSLEPYLGTMANKKVKVEGLFTPGKGASYYNETGWYSYDAMFDANANVTLTGTIDAPVDKGPGAKGAIAGETMTIAATGTDTDKFDKPVSNDGLVTGLYDQNSRYTVGGVPRNGMKGGKPELAAPDDVYNSIYRDFLTAFTYGYWGGVYGNDNTNFWGTFSPPAAPSGGKPSFTAARPKTDPPSLLPYSLWSQTMFKFSDNYNIPYGEDYGSGAPARQSPLLDTPLGGTWRMTIGADGPAGCLGHI